MARGVSMLLIDEKGNRVRTICRECRQLHTAKDCPRACPEPRDQVVGAALRRLATDDLLLLIGALEGPDPGKALSAELLVSASERLQSAMETECLQAGFESLAEFDRLYPATTTPTSVRKHRMTP